MPTASERVTMSAQTRCGEFRVSNAKTVGFGSTGRSWQDTTVQTSRKQQAGYLWYSTVALGPDEDDGKETAGYQCDMPTWMVGKKRQWARQAGSKGEPE